MNIKRSALIITAIVALLAGAEAQESPGVPTVPSQSRVSGNAADPSNAGNLPRLVDLGASKCVPCKMMAPILEEIRKEYDGRLAVEFIDVWKNPGAGREYGVRMIPTQIFYGADGKESFRHEGFFGKEDILAKWRELGVDLGAKTQ